MTLAIEPEPANVVTSAEKAIRLLDEIDSPRLKIVFDGVNLLHGQPAERDDPGLARRLELLAPHVVIAHAKDLGAGRPAIDYVAYLRLLAEFGFGAPLILHGMSESEVPAALTFLKHAMAEAGHDSSGLIDPAMPRFTHDN